MRIAHLVAFGFVALGMWACGDKDGGPGTDTDGGQDTGDTDSGGDSGDSQDSGDSGDTDDTDDTDDTGDPPDSGDPPDLGGCEESEVVELDSTAVAADGFDFSIAAVLAGYAGVWQGTLTLSSGDETTVTVTTSDAVYGMKAVYYEWVGDDTGATDCPPEYVFTGPVTVTTDDGGLNERFNAEISSPRLDVARFGTYVPVGVVQGSSRPTTIDESRWHTISLSLFHEIIGSELEGRYTWGPSPDSETDTGDPPDTDTSDTGGGVLLSEDLGSFTATRTTMAPPPPPIGIDVSIVAALRPQPTP